MSIILSLNFMIYFLVCLASNYVQPMGEVCGLFCIFLELKCIFSYSQAF